jgi:hypothetical protein
VVSGHFLFIYSCLALPTHPRCLFERRTPKRNNPARNTTPKTTRDNINQDRLDRGRERSPARPARAIDASANTHRTRSRVHSSVPLSVFLSFCCLWTSTCTTMRHQTSQRQWVGRSFRLRHRHLSLDHTRRLPVRDLLDELRAPPQWRLNTCQR